MDGTEERRHYTRAPRNRSALPITDTEEKLMHVLERVYTDDAVTRKGEKLGDKHMVGMFGYGAPGHQRWREIARIDLDGPEPDWESLRSVQAAPTAHHC